MSQTNHSDSVISILKIWQNARLTLTLARIGVHSQSNLN